MATVDALTEPIIIAHRGGLDVYPENTLEAFRAAYRRGSLIIEMDCHVLADGDIAVMHDATVDRTTDGTGNVSSLTRAQFKALTCDANAVLGTIHPPCFDEVLAELDDAVVLAPEAKGPGSGAAMTSLIVALGQEARILMQSFNLAELTTARAAGIACIALGNAFSEATLASLAAAGDDYVGVSTAASDAYLANIVAAGMKPIVWTINEAATWATWLGKGAAGVFSDYPRVITGDKADYVARYACGCALSPMYGWTLGDASRLGTVATAFVAAGGGSCGRAQLAVQRGVTVGALGAMTIKKTTATSWSTPPASCAFDDARLVEVGAWA